MATELVTVLNPETGEVGKLSRRLFRIPSIGGNLVEVPAGTKSYDPEFYKPKSKDEAVAIRTAKTDDKTPTPAPAKVDQKKKDDD